MSKRPDQSPSGAGVVVAAKLKSNERQIVVFCLVPLALIDIYNLLGGLNVNYRITSHKPSTFIGRQSENLFALMGSIWILGDFSVCYCVSAGTLLYTCCKRCGRKDSEGNHYEHH
jgi:hypothetical protein